MAASVCRIGRFLGVVTILHVFAFFLLIALKIDGPLAYLNWGVIFMPLWLLQTFFLIMGIRYNNPTEKTETKNESPLAYQNIQKGRRFGLCFLYVLLLSFEIMLVIQLSEIDSYDPYSKVSSQHASHTYEQLQCKWPNSECDDILRLKELENVIRCVTILPISESYIPKAIPVNVLFIPIYIFLLFSLFAIIVPQSFAGYIYIEVFSPVILGSYFSSPPCFGLPTAHWEDMRMTLPPEEVVEPGEMGTFDDKTGTVRELSVRESIRNYSDEENEERVIVNLKEVRSDDLQYSLENPQYFQKQSGSSNAKPSASTSGVTIDSEQYGSPGHPEQDVEDLEYLVDTSTGPEVYTEIDREEDTNETTEDVAIDDTIMY